MFTKSQAEKLAKYIWDGDDYWSNKLKELVLDDEQGKSSTFLMSSELSFDEACRKGVIRFEIEEIDDNCDPPCFLIFPEDKREEEIEFLFNYLTTEELDDFLRKMKRDKEKNKN